MLDWVKEHPYLTGSLVLVILLFFIFRSKSSSAAASTSSTVTAGPSDSVQMAALSANSQIQAATLAAQTQVFGYQAAAQVQNNQTAASVAQTAIAAQVANNTTDAQLQLGLAQIGVNPISAPSSSQPAIVNPVYGQAQAQQGATQAQQTTQATLAAATSVPAPNLTPSVLPSATVPGTNAFVPSAGNLYQSSGNAANDATYGVLETAEPNIPGGAYGTGPLPQVCYGNKCYGGPNISATTYTYDATQNAPVAA